MGSSLFLNGNVDFAPLGKKNPRDRARGSTYHGAGITYGVLSLRGGIAKYQRSLHGKTPIISGLINKNRRNIVPWSHYIPTSFYLYL